MDRREPRMGHNIFSIKLAGSKSGLWVFVEKFEANVAGVVAEEWVVKAWLVILNISKQLLLILIIKRWLSAQHFINNSSKRPPIA
jgi:hypothetical protein